MSLYVPIYIIWVKNIDTCSATCRMVKNRNKRRHLVTSTNVFNFWAGENWSATAKQQTARIERITEPTEPATERQDEPNDLHES